ncbi:MAG: TolC family protein [Candidatus Hydrogenedentes bacterium]|nr:TolC family protein [Candidatus Hydrogenedentota bacterium]
MLRETYGIGLALVVSALTCCGCGTVQPNADYTRAGFMISARTASDSVYNPAEEATIENRIRGLLADGVTAEEAASVALLNNREFQGLFFEIGVSRAEVVQAGLLTNPTLFFNVLIPDGGGRTKLTYGLAQELAELWQLPKRKKSAEEKLESTILMIVNSGIDISMRAKVAYYNAAAATMGEENARKNESLTQEALGLVEKRFSAGDVSELDVNRARANALSAKTDLITAAHEAKFTKATLDRELGLSYWKAPFTLGDALTVTPAPLEEDSVLIASAAENVIDIDIARRGIAAAEADLAAQYRAVLPSVKAGISAERTAQRAVLGRVEQGVAAWKPSSIAGAIPDLIDQSLNGQSPLDTLQALQAGQPAIPTLLNHGIAQEGRFKSLRGTLPDIPTQRQRELSEKQQIDFLWGPSLQVTLPIWDQNRARIAMAQFRLQQKTKEYENTLELLAESVTQKASKMRAAEELAAFFADEAIPLAEENARGAQRIYELGEEGILSVIDAQRELHSIRKAYIGVLRDYEIAKAELEQAMGGRIAEKPLDKESGVADAK